MKNKISLCIVLIMVALLGFLGMAGAQDNRPDRGRSAETRGVTPFAVTGWYYVHPGSCTVTSDGAPLGSISIPWREVLGSRAIWWLRSRSRPRVKRETWLPSTSLTQVAVGIRSSCIPLSKPLQTTTASLQKKPEPWNIDMDVPTIFGRSACMPHWPSRRPLEAPLAWLALHGGLHTWSWLLGQCARFVARISLQPVALHALPFSWRPCPALPVPYTQDTDYRHCGGIARCCSSHADAGTACQGAWCCHTPGWYPAALLCFQAPWLYDCVLQGMTHRQPCHCRRVWSAAL